MAILLTICMAMAAHGAAPPSAQDAVSEPSAAAETTAPEATASADLAPAAAIPPELAGLRALIETAEDSPNARATEDRVVGLVRAFDRQQEAMAEWDLDMAEQLAAKDSRLAEEKSQQAKRRYELTALAYLEVLGKYPGNARAMTYYGELLYDHFGRHAVAVQMWKQATLKDRSFGAPLNDLGIHYCHVGSYDVGFRYFEEAVRLEPKNADILFNLAQSYLIHGPQVKKLHKWSDKRVYDEALALSRRAAELAPNDFEMVQDYAVNFFAAERFGVQADWPCAAKAWEAARAQARTPDEVFYTWLNEGRVWLRQGEKAKAADCLKRALELRPQSEVAQTLLDRAHGNTANAGADPGEAQEGLSGGALPAQKSAAPAERDR